MSQIVQVTTVTPSRGDAVGIARRLVEKRLAACAQVAGPITSIYWWKGSMEEAEEWVCVAKTRGELIPQVEQAIREIHPYQVPEILATPVVAGASSYLAWVVAETQTPAGSE